MKNIGITTVVLMMLGTACSEDLLETYDTAQSHIYFGIENTERGAKSSFTDTTVVSFARYDEDLTELEWDLRVNVLGKYSETARKFDFEIIPEGTTAESGKHYELLANQGTVGGTEVCGYIPVKLLKKDLALKTTYYIHFRLKENADFGLALEKEYVDLQNDKTVNLREHVLAVTCELAPPVTWELASSYFLTFSTKKILLINQLCNKTMDDWDNMQLYILEPMWVRVRNYLQDQINKGTPVYEDEIDKYGNQVKMRVQGLVFN